jgi:hypothetical protein
MSTLNWREAAEVRIAKRADEVRRELAAFVIAIDAFSGFRPARGAFSIRKGALIRKTDPAVSKYPTHWRALSTDEVDRRIRSEARRLEFRAGLR